MEIQVELWQVASLLGGGVAALAGVVRYLIGQMERRMPDRRTKGHDGGQRHGDAAIALALAVYASRVLREPPLVVEYRPAPPRGHHQESDDDDERLRMRADEPPLRRGSFRECMP